MTLADTLTNDYYDDLKNVWGDSIRQTKYVEYIFKKGERKKERKKEREKERKKEREKGKEITGVILKK